MGVDNLAKIIDVIDLNSKLVSDITNVAKNVIAKDPKALDNSFLEFTIKSHFGESMYDKLQKIYQDIIGT
jgi:hypothetical protein